MKKIVIPAAALLLLAASCNVLDKEPLTTIAPTNFFKSADDAESGITAVYDVLQFTGAYGQDLNVVGEMPSDNCTSLNGDVNAMERITWTPTTSQVGNVFRDMYIGINRANAVLKYVPTVEMPAARRDQILGEARFLRALFYFNLVRLYGGVSLHTEPVESSSQDVVALPRASADEVYNQIVQDLTAAEGLVAADQGALNRTRVNKPTVNALQARVYLTMRRWSDAQAAAGKVLGTTVASLVATPKALYPAENKAESIFEVQFAGSTDGGFLLPDLVLPTPPATYSFAKFNIPTLYQSAASSKPTDLTFAVDTLTDLRWKYVGTTNAGRDHVSWVDGPRSRGANDRGPFVYKWTSTSVAAFNSADNYYLLRLADVYLMYTEASNEQNGPNADALTRLNAIRQRAGLPAATLATLGTKQLFRAEVDKQRRLELAFEGERWFDLLRYARHNQAEAGAHAITALDIIQQQKGSADANYLLFPLPQSEINNNAKTQQNPGF
ncbi:RagB/SusD family nutrient uptake outer membrane protein [Hymenobacter sp. 15J16-1T3B]|uniref:RagB/SusD family nutrient uptake outer membrane protein n=1 Tax=Hymenobacter sp. 15J16-1T3B TaxID=2886941 RepID=UPI001D11D7F8|nr:RagB/SusD family nutrient uptake outer membrane protein [Hymenobacter sp. 15J16-1T3B]MCC3156696.1 RagB/SusD family nutrient uptake outer membrane protein [Hymenobacter sp. 15J16-1T3B]